MYRLKHLCEIFVKTCVELRTLLTNNVHSGITLIECVKQQQQKTVEHLVT